MTQENKENELPSTYSGASSLLNLVAVVTLIAGIGCAFYLGDAIPDPAGSIYGWAVIGHTVVVFAVLIGLASICEHVHDTNAVTRHMAERALHNGV